MEIIISSHVNDENMNKITFTDYIFFYNYLYYYHAIYIYIRDFKL